MISLASPCRSRSSVMMTMDLVKTYLFMIVFSGSIDVSEAL